MKYDEVPLIIHNDSSRLSRIVALPSESKANVAARKLVATYKAQLLAPYTSLSNNAMTKTYEVLALAALAAQNKHEAALLEIMNEIGDLDRELVDKAMEVLGDQSATAVWFVSTSSPLGKSPLQAMADGQREEVLRVLTAIEHGLVV